MALLLPGEEPRFRVLELGLAAAAVLGLCALGCATPLARGRRVPPSVFEAARFEARKPEPRPGRGDESARFVERTLRAAGFNFGTDGTAGAVWGYLRRSHRVVAASAARRGDVVFFDTMGTAAAPACADHAGIVDTVEPDGRITFLEARGGRVRRSVVDPGRPAERRDGRGQLLNTFLRPKRPDDPPGARYFAGQMLCGIARAVRR
jgi:hypothetical protein